MATPKLKDVVEQLRPGQNGTAMGGGPMTTAQAIPVDGGPDRDHRSIVWPNRSPNPGVNPATGAPAVDPNALGTPTSIEDLIRQFTTQGDDARAANEARAAEIRGLTQQVVDQFAPGGGFGKGFEDQINRLKTQNVAGATQSLVSSGLSNTTQAAALGNRFEQDIGTPARLRLADLQAERLAGAVTNQAGFIERFNEPAPDPSLLAGLVTQATDTPENPDDAVTTLQGGDITDQVFKAEKQRRQKFKNLSRRQGNIGKNIEKVQNSLDSAAAGSKKEARLKKQLEKLQGRSGELGGRITDLGESSLSDDIFESETTRRRDAAIAAEEEREGSGGVTRTPPGTFKGLPIVFGGVNTQGGLEQRLKNKGFTPFKRGRKP